MSMHTHDQDSIDRRQLVVRLGGLLSMAALLAGCNTSRQTAALPDVNWPEDELRRPPAPRPRPAAPKPAAPAGLPTGIIPRSDWAKGAPIAARMTPAQTISRITIHHDGMDSFTSTDRGSAAARLEQIRNAHLNRPGEPFGDIGYHYVIDPAGRVWQGRTLQWQGAHVAKQNQGNLGICVLGNYQIQNPSDRSLETLDRFVGEQMATYRVPTSRVYTHRELASTACPGNNLQPLIARSRSAGFSSRA